MVFACRRATSENSRVSWQAKAQQLRAAAIVGVHTQSLQVSEPCDLKYEIDDAVASRRGETNKWT
jgi:hypothetical protein